MPRRADAKPWCCYNFCRIDLFSGKHSDTIVLAGIGFFISLALGMILWLLGTAFKENGLLYTAYCLWGIDLVLTIGQLFSKSLCRELFCMNSKPQQNELK